MTTGDLETRDLKNVVSSPICDLSGRDIRRLFTLFEQLADSLFLELCSPAFDVALVQRAVRILLLFRKDLISPSRVVRFAWIQNLTDIQAEALFDFVALLVSREMTAYGVGFSQFNYASAISHRSLEEERESALCEEKRSRINALVSRLGPPDLNSDPFEAARAAIMEKRGVA